MVERLDIKQQLLAPRRRETPPGRHRQLEHVGDSDCALAEGRSTISGATGSARTSSTRRATCGCSRSSRPPRPIRASSRPSPASAITCSARAWSSRRTRRTSSAITSRSTAWCATLDALATGRLHHRGDRRDHRARARPAGQRHVPDHGHRRHRRPGARDAQSRRATAERSRSGRVRVPPSWSSCSSAAHSARRPARASTSDARTRRRIGDLDARSGTLEYRPKASRRASRRSKPASRSTTSRARAHAVQRHGQGRRVPARARSRRRSCTRHGVTPDIAHSIDDVDRVMRWGFGWELGPFELFDAIGVTRSARGGRSGRTATRWPAASRRWSRAAARWRTHRGSATGCPPAAPDLQILRTREGTAVASSRRMPVRASSTWATACSRVEFHSKMNAIGGDTIQMLQRRRQGSRRRTARRSSSATTRRISPPAPT